MLLRLIQYLNTTANYGLHWKTPTPLSDGTVKVIAYCDSDHAGDGETRRSTSGYAVYLRGGNGDMLIDWASKSQKLTSISTGEAETVALKDARDAAKDVNPLTKALNKIASVVSAATRSAIPARMLLGFLTKKTRIPLEYHTDSEACRKGLLNFRNSNMKYLNKTRDIHLCWLNEQVHMPDTTVHRVDSEGNVADIFTKPLVSVLFNKHRVTLGVK